MKHINLRDYDLELDVDRTRVAYKNGKFYEVFCTTTSYCIGNCMGRIRIVFGADDQVLSYGFPMMKLDNDFTEYFIEQLLEMQVIVDNYRNYICYGEGNTYAVSIK